jgi:hypothetical protein
MPTIGFLGATSPSVVGRYLKPSGDIGHPDRVPGGVQPD